MSLLDLRLHRDPPPHRARATIKIHAAVREREGRGEAALREREGHGEGEGRTIAAEREMALGERDGRGGGRSLREREGRR